MYTLFISKSKNAYKRSIRSVITKPRNHFYDLNRNMTDLYLHLFLEKEYSAEDERNLIICPGYLSKENSTASSFARNYFDTAYHYNLGILDGMSTSRRTKINQDEIKLLLTTNVDFLYFDRMTRHNGYPRTKEDHRKMTFICRNSIMNHGAIISKADVTTFVHDLEIDAILIGSTNVSNNSYYNNVKGEADILMFKSESFANFVKAFLDDTSDDVPGVLSKSISRIDNTYFNKILMETLNDQLP